MNEQTDYKRESVLIHSLVTGLLIGKIVDIDNCVIVVQIIEGVPVHWSEIL